MKKIIILIASLFCCVSFAASTQVPTFANCTPANPWPDTEPGFDKNQFCNQFQAAALCHCEASYPAGYCNKIGIAGIYKIMIGRYGSISEACHEAHGEVDEPTCNAEWTYYLKNCPMTYKI